MVLHEQFDHNHLTSVLGVTEEHGAVLTFTIAAVMLEGVKGENMKKTG